MAGQQTSVLNKTRRKADTWDRIKFLIILLIITTAIVGSQVQPPFVTLGQALSDFLASTPGRIIALLFILETLRQTHYFISERSERYHGFWQNGVFGTVEGGLSHFKPWTRFRVGRLIRWTIIVAIYALVMDYFRPEIASPIDAIAQTPRMFLAALPMILQLVMMISIVILQFVAIFWFLSRGGMDVLMPEEINTRFSDVWGQDHVLRLIKENIAFLEKPDEIEAKGGYIPGGILLWGPPGTGKTLLAEGIAGETGKPYVFVEPGAFIQMFMGVGILKVKSLYRKLRKLSLRHGGVIVFFDEADSLGSRGGLGAPGLGQPGMAHGGGGFNGFQCNGFSYLSPHSQKAVLTEMGVELNPQTVPAPPRSLRDRIIMGMGGGGMGTLQALLTEMNGLKKPRGFTNKIRKLLGFRPKPAPKYRILTIMATNMPNALDEAMLRPGRIDRIYKMGYPSKDGRLQTLRGYLDKVKHELTEEQVEKLATVTPYYSGAKIKDLVNEALIQAIRNDRYIVTWDDIWKAKALKELGPAEDAEYIQRERHAVAVHEASHAVVAHTMRRHMQIDLVTIERHGDTGGMVKNLLAEDRFTQWKSEFETDIMVSLASLAGERMFFDDDNSSGVTGDLRSATAVAALMEGVWGMGDRYLSLTVNETGMGQSGNAAAVAVARRQDEINTKLTDLYDKTWNLLDEHRDEVLRIAAVLEEKKTISGDEVSQIMGSPPGARAMREPKGWQVIFDETNDARHNGAVNRPASQLNGDRADDPAPDPAEDPA
ncbi:MAG: AAA family ATPase [Acidimicrobiia bacterium]